SSANLSSIKKVEPYVPKKKIINLPPKAPEFKSPVIPKKTPKVKPQKVKKVKAPYKERGVSRRMKKVYAIPEMRTGNILEIEAKIKDIKKLPDNKTHFELSKDKALTKKVFSEKHKKFDSINFVKPGGEIAKPISKYNLDFIKKYGVF